MVSLHQIGDFIFGFFFVLIFFFVLFFSKILYRKTENYLKEFIDIGELKFSVKSTDARKKDRRKVRASSLESSTESESSAMETGEGNSGQVAAVSSTASFKSPAVAMGEEETNGEKQVQTFI